MSEQSSYQPPHAPAAPSMEPETWSKNKFTAETQRRRENLKNGCPEAARASSSPGFESAELAEAAEEEPRSTEVPPKLSALSCQFLAPASDGMSACATS